MRALLGVDELFDQGVLGLEDFGGAGVFAGDLFAGPLVGFGEGVFFVGYVVRFRHGALWWRWSIDGDGRRSRERGARSWETGICSSLLAPGSKLLDASR